MFGQKRNLVADDATAIDAQTIIALQIMLPPAQHGLAMWMMLLEELLRLRNAVSTEISFNVFPLTPTTRSPHRTCLSLFISFHSCNGPGGTSLITRLQGVKRSSSKPIGACVAFVRTTENRMGR